MTPPTARTIALPINPQFYPRIIRRNEPCPCGSGRKFKRCCLSTKVTNQRLIITRKVP